MAKNEPLGTVTYLRKDTNFFADGVWYISTPCPVHGLVDESVTWEEAKTPHHAGVIADDRHQACHLKADEEQQRAYALAEIEAAAEEVKRAEGVLKWATDACDEKAIARHREGLDHARRRHREIKKTNSGK